MLEGLRVVLQVLKTDREQLADDYEADQVVYVAYVELAYEALHLRIYNRYQSCSLP